MDSLELSRRREVLLNARQVSASLAATPNALGYLHDARPCETVVKCASFPTEEPGQKAQTGRNG